MFSRSIHIVANVRISLFLVVEQCSIVYIYHIIFIHPPIVGPSGCFCILATVNGVSVNIGVHVYFQISAGLYIYMYVCVCVYIHTQE